MAHGLCELFGTTHPILQAPMGGASSLDMALAVGQAGGLGALAFAGASPEKVEASLAAYKRQSGAPLNANFFAYDEAADDPDRDARWLAKVSGLFAEYGIELPKDLDGASVVPFSNEYAHIVEEYKPEVVSFHFGLPAADLVARVKAAGCKIISSATTVQEAIWLEANGCDAVIAQGLEAGGHRGLFLDADLTQQIGTFSLVPQVADAVSVPVIAAGGIADRRGVNAALALGASGVQVGTAYLFTKEAAISSSYRQALEGARGHGTAVSNIVSGRPTRVIKNRFVRDLGPISSFSPTFPKGFLTSGPLCAAAEGQGQTDMGAYYCGQSAPVCQVLNAFELTQHLAGHGSD